MRRPDPLLLLTLLGLVLSGVLAMLHPHEAFDPDDPHRQVGRNVTVRLEVLSSEQGDTWSRGLAVPIDLAPVTASGRVDGAVSFVWFRPDARPHPGDRLAGTARVTDKGNDIELLLSGATAAHIDPGPHPVSTRWADLVARPEAYKDRALTLVARYDEGAIHSPDGAHHCDLDGDPRDATTERWTIRLVPDPERPGWRCAEAGP